MTTSRAAAEGRRTPVGRCTVSWTPFPMPWAMSEVTGATPELTTGATPEMVSDHRPPPDRSHHPPASRWTGLRLGGSRPDPPSRHRTSRPRPREVIGSATHCGPDPRSARPSWCARSWARRSLSGHQGTRRPDRADRSVRPPSAGSPHPAPWHGDAAAIHKPRCERGPPGTDPHHLGHGRAMIRTIEDFDGISGGDGACREHA